MLTLPLLLCTTQKIAAQQTPIDSLETLLKNAQLHDTTRLNIMEMIVDNTTLSDSVFMFYHKAIHDIAFRKLNDKNSTPAVKNRYDRSRGNWYSNEGYVLHSGQHYEEAIQHFEKAVSIFKYLKMEPEMWAAVNNKGHSLRKMGDLQGAITCFFSALKHQESTGDKMGIAMASTSIATAYEELEKYDQAIIYYKKGLAYYDALKHPAPQDLYEQAIILTNTGRIYSRLKKNEEARTFLLKALAIGKEHHFSNNVSFVYTNLGRISIEEQKYDEAQVFFEEGLPYAGNDRAKANILNGLGEISYKKGSYNKSITYFNKALQYGKLCNDPAILMYTASFLHRTYKATNNYKASLGMLELYGNMRDSLNVADAKSELIKQQLKYDYEKKELNYKLEERKKMNQVQLAAQRKNAAKNRALIILVAALVLLSVGSYLLYRNYKQKQVISLLEKNELRQKLLLAQMNPHFIFNSIDNIQSLIYNKQDEDAISYLTRFSRLMRQILENSGENYIAFSEELQMTDNYLAIQQLLYNNKFDYSIQVDEGINPDHILLPPMLTQPFVENSIKHGFREKGEKGFISIRFSLSNAKLYFEITDNGSGFGNAEADKNRKSMAMAITRERLSSYARQHDTKVDTENITGRHNEITGARVRFEMPYIYDQ